MSGEKVKLVPKLRFPEFRALEGWKVRQIGEVFKVTRGDVLSMTLVQDEKSAEASYPVYSSQTKNTGLSGYYSEFLYEDAITWTTDGANAGDVNYRSGKFYCTNVCGVLINTEGYANPCVAALINSVSKSYVSYVGNPKLMNGVMAKIAIPFPTVKEQQKITDCLSSLDELIAAQARKVNALKTHKKGLMQQLFPREGETQPRLRFPEFRDAGGWREMLLGDLNPFVTSGSRGWAAFYAGEGDLFVRMTNLGRGSIALDLTDSKFVQLPLGANEGVRTQLKEHDVLISITADIGIIGYVDKSVPSPAYINQHIALVRFDSGKLCGKYVAYFLASERSQQRFRSATDTGTKAGMSLIGIQKIKLMLPSLSEQKRIADCLTSLDTLITAATQELDTLRTHKKGLMQQIFPSTEAVEA